MRYDFCNASFILFLQQSRVLPSPRLDQHSRRYPMHGWRSRDKTNNREMGHLLLSFSVRSVFWHPISVPAISLNTGYACTHHLRCKPPQCPVATCWNKLLLSLHAYLIPAPRLCLLFSPEAAVYFTLFHGRSSDVRFHERNQYLRVLNYSCAQKYFLWNCLSSE